MPLEIERRFLPKSSNWRPDGDATPITQGYFLLGEKAVARVIKWPWPHLVLNNRRVSWLSLKDFRELKPHLTPDGMLPAGWKIRIRSYFNARYVLDIKGPRTATTRFELAELQLDPSAGRRLQSLCGDTVLSKKRYVLPHLGHDWQVDVYEGKHEGLVTCEVELRSANAIVKLPSWVGEEITDRKLFGN